MTEVNIEDYVPCGLLEYTVETQNTLLEEFGQNLDGVRLPPGPGGVGAMLFGGLGGDTPLEAHAAASDLGSQLVLRPPPSEAEGTSIAYEEPSCPSYARFEGTVFPRLKSKLVDSDQSSFVYRGIPVVYPYINPAVLALEVPHDRSAAVFWAFKDLYYREQVSARTENVRDRPRQFLADRIDVNAAAVIDDVETKTSRKTVNPDLQVSRDVKVRATQMSPCSGMNGS
jgi:hypothetical protein